MTSSELIKMRLQQQQLTSSNYKDAKSLLKWMTAMQAQNLNMAKWAIAQRLKSADMQLVEDAIDKAEIIRTHLLRPTWHFVAADDVYWLLELSAAKLLPAFKAQFKSLELDSKTLIKSLCILEKSLEGRSLGRNNLVEKLEEAGINTSNSRASYILFYAELEGLICSGKTISKQNTYALLAERVPNKLSLSKSEALAQLALRYFSSHGPATFADFSWWASLNKSELKVARQGLQGDFQSIQFQGQQYWYKDFPLNKSSDPNPVILLAGFDEYIISYKNREDIIPKSEQWKAISSNGIFKPTLLLDGRVQGTWRLEKSKSKFFIYLELFPSQKNNVNKDIKSLIEEEAVKYSRFLGQDLQVKYI